MRVRLPLAALLSCLALVAAARAATPPAQVGGVRPAEAAAGFAQVLAPRTFVFPADHGPHPEYRQEWWYTTGNLAADDGERFGFELTFFRFALAPPGTRPPGDSAWRAREIYMAHFAVTDPQRGRFRFAQQLARAALGLAGAQGAPLKVWLEDWYLVADPGEDQRWRLHAAGEGYGLDLQLDVSGTPVLNGAAGLSVKSGSGRAMRATTTRCRASRCAGSCGARDAGAARLRPRLGRSRVGQRGPGGAARSAGTGSRCSWTMAARSCSMRCAPPPARATRTAPAPSPTRPAVAQPLPSGGVAIEVTRTWTSAGGRALPGRLAAARAGAGARPRGDPAARRTRSCAGRRATGKARSRCAARAPERALAGRGYVELVGYRPER